MKVCIQAIHIPLFYITIQSGKNVDVIMFKGTHLQIKIFQFFRVFLQTFKFCQLLFLGSFLFYCSYGVIKYGYG
ncbi:hypothetical protein LI326_10615 [Blautia marasmi]|nr:hypothetical protein [Blautia marasmi]